MLVRRPPTENILDRVLLRSVNFPSLVATIALWSVMMGDEMTFTVCKPGLEVISVPSVFFPRVGSVTI